MKNIIYILLLSCFVSNAQEQIKRNNWKVELIYTTDIINTSFGNNYGFIFKGKRKIFENKTFTLMTGFAYQNSVINENKNKFTSHVDGSTRDISIAGLLDVSLYPFRNRRFFISLQPFLGFTNLKSKGSISIEHLDIYEKHSKSYSYFNYGAISSLGYTFNKVTINLDIWSSLKGFFDAGRFRPGDLDSRLFFGLGAGYSF
ncbi:hypothetical protein [Tenacibaculum soleae]|uniref:hypothetical protein n=1 Tax=Tenacibaculum soleae TaxID=447689 RepID=UPI00230076D1|nr:hypothetical protein [Tenacibaculum soleae]